MRLSNCSSCEGTMTCAAANPATTAAPIDHHGCSCVQARGSTPCPTSLKALLRDSRIAADARSASRARYFASDSGSLRSTRCCWSGLSDVVAELSALLDVFGFILRYRPGAACTRDLANY